MKEGLKIDNNIIPKRSTVQFLHGPVMLADILTWAISTVGPINFGAKYHVGRARPEVSTKCKQQEDKTRLIFICNIIGSSMGYCQ